MNNKKKVIAVKTPNHVIREKSLLRLRFMKLFGGLGMIILGILWFIDSNPEGQLPIAWSVAITIVVVSLLIFFTVPLWRKVGQQDEYEQQLALQQRAKSFEFLGFSLLLIVIFYNQIPQNVPLRALLVIVLGLAWIIDSRADDLYGSKKS